MRWLHSVDSVAESRTFQTMDGASGKSAHRPNARIIYAHGRDGVKSFCKYENTCYICGKNKNKNQLCLK